MRDPSELAAVYATIERALTHHGFRAKQAAWATMAELVREAFLLMAPGSSIPR